MKPALRPSLVITVSIGLAACGSTRTSNPPPPEMSHNPPMPQMAGGAGGSSGGGAAEVASGNLAPLAGNPPPQERDFAKPSAFKTHPRDAAGNVIFKDKLGGCFVEIPFASTKPRQPGERHVREEKLVCPPVMSDPAYGKCLGGLIELKGDKCFCLVGGNPPPPPLALECPSR